ncbi:hypothetical protein, partial [Streptomyces scabiei]|uniref:hypothetical protein n=1 Tax=Streptomyces scabiei TaxID=1930 RepID=UPI0029A802CE|nr:hypothetical protein [Streptomyces scabiei]
MDRPDADEGDEGTDGLGVGSGSGAGFSKDVDGDGMNDVPPVVGGVTDSAGADPPATDPPATDPPPG